MLKQFALIALLLAGCEGSKKDEPAAAPPPDPGAAPAASEDTAKWAAAHEAVESLQKELELTEAAITIYNNVLENKGSLTTEATIKEAHEKLPQLEREKSELTAKLAAAQAEEAKYKAGADAVRMKGLEMSEECKKNPLAKGCS
jgi:hypothetical protein